MLLQVFKTKPRADWLVEQLQRANQSWRGAQVRKQKWHLKWHFFRLEQAGDKLGLDWTRTRTEYVSPRLSHVFSDFWVVNFCLLKHTHTHCPSPCWQIKNSEHFLFLLLALLGGPPQNLTSPIIPIVPLVVKALHPSLTFPSPWLPPPLIWPPQFHLKFFS